MKTLSVEVSGVEALLANLGMFGQAAERAAKAALYQEAETVMTASKELVPVDTGALRGSGHVQQPVERGSRIEVSLGYGGPAAPYALVVHEDMKARHPTGEAKYLERPLLDAERGMLGRIADRIRAMAMKGRR